MTTRNFMDLLEGRWQAGAFISIGLDPEPSRLPEQLHTLDLPEAILNFNKTLIEATADLAVDYKPNIAFYEALGADGLRVLRETVAIANDLAPTVPVIMDAKRADIGNTNDKYVTATFEDLRADAITVHPYLGPEAMQPFLDQKDKGIIVLCRTSNPGAGRYQDLVVDGRPLYQHIAADVASTWNTNGNCGLVVGATYPQEMTEVRSIVGDMPILVPGIGAQGGDVEQSVKNGMNSRGSGLMLHAGRSIIYAYEKNSDVSVGEATRAAAQELHDQITAARQQ